MVDTVISGWGRTLRYAVVCIAGSTAACASGSPPPTAAPAPRATIEAPVGEHYVIHYVDDGGLRRRDTRSGIDSMMVSIEGSVVESKESRDKRHIAVAFERGDSKALAIIDVTSGGITEVHAVPGAARYSLAWSADGETLGVGYRVEGADGQRRASGIALIDIDGTVRDVGCSVSNRFVAWVANGRLAVGDGVNYYIVNPRGCGTVATIPLRGKQDVTFSPDGRKMFLRRGPQDQYSRQQAGNRLELHVADYNGANSRRVTDYRFEARNARWSPDSRKIAFELKSQRFANLWHVAVYDLARDQATFDAKQRTLGQPQDGEPFWSPGGDKLVHDRSFARRGAGQSYSTNQKVVKVLPEGSATLSNSAEIVVAEEVSQEGTVTGEPIGRTLGWIDDTHIAFSSSRWTRITNIDQKQTYDLPPSAHLLGVAVVDAAP